jgi:type II secretory pathway pseudopilin PulG
MRTSRAFTLVELLLAVGLLFLVTAIAIPMLFRGRVGTTEDGIMGSVKGLLEAQAIYIRTDYDGDGVLEYAQVIRGSAGVVPGGSKTDHGLYTTGTSQGVPAMIDSSLANADQAWVAHTPKAGYTFRILTKGFSRDDPPGGTPQTWLATRVVCGQVIPDVLVLGFGVTATPTTARDKLVHYLASSEGSIYQADLGHTTPLTIFDVRDKTKWKLCE